MKKEENKIKPTNPEKGWGLKKEFIDCDGKVFNKGVYNELATAKYKETLKDVNSSDENNEINEEQDIPQKTKKDIELEEIDLKEELKRQNKTIELLVKKISSLEDGNKGSAEIDYKNFAEALAHAQGKQSMREPVYDAGKSPQDDLLENPILFTSHGIGRCFVDKRNKNGYIESTPSGKIIEFKRLGSKTSVRGREKVREYVCGYKTNYKSEVNWFRTHPEYGLTIFEDIKDVFDADVEYMKIAAEELKTVNNMEHSVLISNAKHFDVKLGGSLEDVKTQIALKRAKQKIGNNRKHIEDLLKRNNEIKEFMPDKISE